MHIGFDVTKRTVKKAAVGVAAITLTVLATASSCDESPGDQESKRTQGGYKGLVAGQPAKQMAYSPTRRAANFWIETWDSPNKLSYVYLQSASGKMLGYYIFKGLPVSYCVSLTPPDQVDDGDGTGDYGVARKAPSVDGVYYGSGDCARYYGIDASTGAYVEYTTGTGINVLLFDQPLPSNQNVEPLGYSEVKGNKVVKR